ncbi:conserved hypothetical protein [Burkholderiales bacterium 8X]|nr:conserved hypothetical protein [Burkholderiales bacterium 8X]
MNTPASSSSSSSASSIAAVLAPTGKLRASINLGNPILAGRAPDGSPRGVSVDLANAFATELGLELELVVFDKAAASVDAVRAEKADIGFFAIDPARSDGLRFTAPYVLIEGSYLVPESAAFGANEDVDRPGVRVAVGQGSAYDLFLTRAIGQASLVRVEGAAGVMKALAAGEADVAAGIRQVLEAEAAQRGGVRLLPGRFMVIQQAMGLPASRGAEAQALLANFVEARKASGFVAEALARHRIQGAIVAPAA